MKEGMDLTRLTRYIRYEESYIKSWKEKEAEFNSEMLAYGVMAFTILMISGFTFFTSMDIILSSALGVVSLILIICSMRKRKKGKISKQKYQEAIKFANGRA